MRSSVAFIGLGVMGLPMARNLVTAGFDVIGYNRSGSKSDLLVASGGAKAGSVADAVAAADAIALMLPDSDDVQAVCLGSAGVFAHARADALVIDFSTIRPDVSVSLAATASGVGLRMIDAPVSGGEQAAIDATLSVMVGGPLEALEAAEPILRSVGKTITHVGPPGSGQIVKAANQILVAGNIELLAEAIVLLESHGVDARTALEALGGGLAGSAVLARKGAAMLERDFEPGFRLQLHHKDMGIAVAAAREVGAAIPLGAHVAQLIGSAVARGDGGLDHTALLRLVLAASGRDLSQPTN